MERRPVSRPGRFLRRTLAAVVSIALAGVGAEIALRTMLFGSHPAFASLRRPGYYASRFDDDDYWKLQRRFRRAAPSPAVHPTLGWVGAFDPETLRHRLDGELRGRKPVLIYGDSFAEGVRGVARIDELVNEDEAFAAGHYLLNYGVSGYGLDQILLLLRGTIGLYPDPVVVVSWMTLDLDRVVLTVRELPKPFFRIEDGRLALHGTPLSADPEIYYEAHPPQVGSYLVNRMRYSRSGRRIAHWLGWGERRSQEKEQLGRAILDALVQELRARETPTVLLILHPHLVDISTLDGEGEWRDAYFREVLRELDVDALWSKDLVREALAGGSRPEDLIDPRNAHPTALYNQIVARAICARVLTGF